MALPIALKEIISREAIAIDHKELAKRSLKWQFTCRSNEGKGLKNTHGTPMGAL